jgi:CubicO group peptidase (beta-lactamase class C family)
MKVKKLLATWLVLLLSAFPYLESYGQLSTTETIRQYGESFSKTHHCNLAIGIIKGTHEERFYFDGKKSPSGKKTDSATIFAIGELSSLFTTALLSVEEKNGRMNLNDDADIYLPSELQLPVYREVKCEPLDKTNYGTSQRIHTGYYCFPDPSYHPEKIVLCDLASGTSGLPAYPLNYKNHSSGNPETYGIKELSAFLKTYNPAYPPQYYYVYSPLAISLAALCISEKQQQSYADVLSQQILLPLHMSHTGFCDPGCNLMVTNCKSDISLNRYGILNPSLGMFSTIDDMMKFLSANMTTESSSLQEAFQKTHNPRTVITHPKKMKNSSAGLGWIITAPDKESQSFITWQENTTGENSCYIGFSSIRNEAVIILSDAKAHTRQLGEQILLELSKENSLDKSAAIRE